MTKQYQNMISLSKKHQRTLDKIFENPVRSDVAWRDIEAMLKAMGCRVEEGNGSRVRLYQNERVATFHRPHPQKETDKGALKSMRKFLCDAGVTNA